MLVAAARVLVVGAWMLVVVRLPTVVVRMLVAVAWMSGIACLQGFVRKVPAGECCNFADLD